MKNLLSIVFIITAILFPGCYSGNGNKEGVFENRDEQAKTSRLSNKEVEGRLRDYNLDLDSAANMAELFNSIAEKLGIEIVIEAERISPETAVNLKNSHQSFVIQILEVVTASTKTRYEVRKGKLWIKDAD